MKKLSIAAASFLGLAFVLGIALAGENLKSGPQTGDEVPGPFHPLNLTGDKAGEKNCLYCSNGNNPVAMIFARDLNEPVTNLIKKIDAATAEHSDAKMGSFVVFLNDSEELQKKAKEVADKEKIKKCVLSVDNPAGPKGYNVSKDAEVTVVLYTAHTVKANYAFSKGELDDKAIEKVLADVTKILPKTN
jgi:hypothetical protein